MNTTNTNAKPLDLGEINIGSCFNCKDKIYLSDLGYRAFERETAGFVCVYCVRNGVR